MNYYIVELNNKISFHFAFVGMKITLPLSDGNVMALIFPTVVKEDVEEFSLYKLRSPYSFQFLNVDISSWGSINHFSNSSFPPFNEARIEAIAVESECSDSGLIKRIVDRFFYYLTIIKAGVIKYDKPKSKEKIVKSIAGAHDNLFIQLSSIINEEEPYITIDDLYFVLSNLDKDISIQYDLLNKAEEFLFTHDYRNALLNYATIVDVTLKQQIFNRITEDISFSKEAKDIVSEANGFRKFIQIMALLKIPIYRDKWIEELMKKRNKIIHEGVSTEGLDLKECRNSIFALLKFYKITFFINQSEAKEHKNLITWVNSGHK